jgi:hypothetical protein
MRAPNVIAEYVRTYPEEKETARGFVKVQNGSD